MTKKELQLMSVSEIKKEMIKIAMSNKELQKFQVLFDRLKKIDDGSRAFSVLLYGKIQKEYWKKG